MTATWPDQPVSADTAVEALEVHHRRGKERTDEEQAKLDELDANLAELRKRRPTVAPLHDNHLHVSFATGGVVESDVTGDEAPLWLTGCRYDDVARVIPRSAAELYGADLLARLNEKGGDR